MLNLDLSLKQNIKISNKLIESLNLLSMPINELDKFLKNESEENVMLDFQSSLDDKNFVKLLKNEKSPNSRQESLDFDRLNPKLENFTDFLLYQLIEENIDSREEKILRYLIYSLDEKGYLDSSLEDISKILKYPLDLVKSCHKILLTFEPKGVGARNLKECLLAQIQTTDENLIYLVKNHLEDLSDNKYSSIMEQMNLDKEDFLELIKKLQKLSPIPGNYKDESKLKKFVTPEIFLDYDNGKLNIHVEKNNPINLNQHYLSLLEGNLDKKTKAYLKDKLNRTLLIKKAIDKRNKTVEEISKYLINYQEDFFLNNMPLKAIREEDIANFFDISISTVSRAIKDKYVQYPNGTILLQELFSSSINGNMASKDYILKFLSLLIEGEDRKNPLSDEKIRLLLKKMDIKIERRTIQKYRKELEIPSSYKRKKIYELKK